MSSSVPPARKPLPRTHWSPATALAFPVVLGVGLALLALAGDPETELWLAVPTFVTTVLVVWAWFVSAFTFVTRLGEKGMVTGGFLVVTRVRWQDVNGAWVMPDGQILVTLKNGKSLTVRTYQRSSGTGFLGTETAERLAERITEEAEATFEDRVWNDDGLVELRRSWWLSPLLLVLLTLGHLWVGTLLASWLYW